jgi:hypothetical protein
MKFGILLFLVLFSLNNWAQSEQAFEAFDDDLNVGGDIFSDFNEDLEASQVLEDERFYRYGRFFCVNLGLGMTTFTGSRGLAYDDNHPTYNLSLTFFNNFQSAIILGLEYSKHTMLVDSYTLGHRTQIVGAIETSMLRPFVGFRYYFDTSDLGTAITYSNPYIVGRMEYWYQTNVFIDAKNLSDDAGGGLGTGIGAGLEFPIVLKDRYVGVEFLFHTVNFFDKYTTDWQRIPKGKEEDDPRSDDPNKKLKSKDGWNFDDLTGNVLSLMVTYVFNW